MGKTKAQDGAYLMYVKDGQMYPVIMTEDQHQMLQLFAQAFNPLRLAPYPQQAATYQELKEKGLIK